MATTFLSGLMKRAGAKPDVTPISPNISIRSADYSNEGRNYQITPAEYSHEGRNSLSEVVPEIASFGNNKSKVKRTNKKNPLNSYRSYSYIFTLAALDKSALEDPSKYRENQDYFVIAKSGGKGSGGLRPPSLSPTLDNTTDVNAGVLERRAQASANKKTIETAQSNNSLVTEFNTKSPGRFDFFINNVHIDTIMGFSKDTGLSVATNITFDIVEPYSMTGFIEALQASAIASGHDQYINTPYVLKMEFIGYPDSDQLPDNATIDAHNTRYFVFSFTDIAIDVNESGARYQCKGVPHNERGFGEPARLKKNIQIRGQTVGEILTNFEKNINEAKKLEASTEHNTSIPNAFDEYTILFPEISSSGEITNSSNNKIASAKVTNLLKSSEVFAFPEEVSLNKTTYTASLSPTDSTIQFADKANIHDCIIAIIRDSSFVSDILIELSKPNSSAIDSYGMVEYFSIQLDVVEKSIINEATHKPYYQYIYMVIPYKIHYTRIPLMQKDTVDPSTKFLLANREYDYIYSGNNIDIKTFNLKFNTLFFQAIPATMGNKLGVLSAQQSTGPDSTMIVNAPTIDSESIKNRAFGVSPVMQSAAMSDNQSAGLGASQPQSTPYLLLARNMHQAILDNVDQCTAEIDIVGDPYYLVTSGMANYHPPFAKTADAKGYEYGETIDGEAAYTSGDVMILIIFKNPSDIDPISGEVIFDQSAVPYSGLFRVISVISKFTDGIFSQTLSLIRIPAQLEDTNTPFKSVSTVLNARPDPTQNTTPIASAQPSAIRSPTTNLIASIATGLPTSGLPGLFSNLAQGLGGGLSGFSASANSFGSTLNQAVQNGINGVSSAIRLASAGLTSLSPPSVVTAGASIINLSSTAQSAGVPNPYSLAPTTLAAGLSATSQIGESVLSASSSLGTDASLLISNVGEKIDKLTRSPYSLSGITTPGLTTNFEIQSKLNSQITAAAASIPAGVDLTLATNAGLILNSIPVSNLPNIPATQPYAIASPPDYNIVDIQRILDQGGTLSNIPGASTLAGVPLLIPTNAAISLPTGLSLNANSVAEKMNTIQNRMSSITGQTLSIEAGLNTIRSAVPTGIPNTSNVLSSVVTKFGSMGSKTDSPLITILKANS